MQRVKYFLIYKEHYYYTYVLFTLAFICIYISIVVAVYHIHFHCDPQM